jgi:hypothetical protein
LLDKNDLPGKGFLRCLGFAFAFFYG